MQLYILDKNPQVCAELLPKKFRFKMLLELAQMVNTVSGCGTYKSIKQGKEIQYFIKAYRFWVMEYYWKLFEMVKINTKLKDKTKEDLIKIYFSYPPNHVQFEVPKYAPFRYKNTYNSLIPSGQVLPIDECIAEYTKYLEWKINYETKK
jgi:hypothetical protein